MGFMVGRNWPTLGQLGNFRGALIVISFLHINLKKKAKQLQMLVIFSQ